MKICVIGDLHGDLGKVKKINFNGIDLILLTGDLGSADKMRKMHFDNIERIKNGLDPIEYSNEKHIEAYMEAYDSSIEILKYLSKICKVFFIYGNVETSKKETKKMSKKLKYKLPILENSIKLLDNVYLINNKLIEIDGLRIGGLEYFVDINWVQEFQPNDYKIKMRNAKKSTKKIIKILKKYNNLDILLTHQPPYEVLDKVTAKFAPKQWQGKNAGSKTILNYIKEKSPKYVFCGHIHEGFGEKNIKSTKIFNMGMGENKIFEI